MKLFVAKNYGRLLFVTFFLLFSGYNSFLMIWSNLGFVSQSRLLTIPFRISVVFLLGVCWLIYRKWTNSIYLFSFLGLSMSYFVRILYEYLIQHDNYHMPTGAFALYFAAFVFFPFLFVLNLNDILRHIKKIYFAILSSTLLFSILTLIYYKSIIGTVGRISFVVKAHENYVSPLALGYSAAVGIGLGVTYLVTNKQIAKKIKLFVIAIIVLNMIPFFLGASRGAAVALILGLLFLLYNFPSLKKKVFIFILLFVTGYTIVLVNDIFNSSLIDRLVNLKENVILGNESAVRIKIWNACLDQFLMNPFFGDSLESSYLGYRPHNLFLEVMVTTGIFGLIFFLVFLFLTIIYAQKIIKYDIQYSWVSVLVIICLIMQMFSGSLYSASWFFLTSGILFSLVRVNFFTRRVN